MLEQDFLGFKVFSFGFSEKIMLGAILCAVIANDPDPGTEEEELMTQTPETAAIEISLGILHMKNKMSEESE